MNEVAPHVFTEGSSFASLHHFFQANQFSSCFVLVDQNTVLHCYPLVASHLPKHEVIQIEAGEEHKLLSACEMIWKKLTEQNTDRNALLINLGGGVIGDLGGFAAGCYKRGISFINIPTTLLAMVDANVGAKTGVDFLGFKNQIGLFNQPKGVFVYTGFLKTLPSRELKSGFAEVIKHYLISDKEAFQYLNSSVNPNWNELVEKNIRIKHHIVSQDPEEKNIRKALNFGHTIGHAVESSFLKNKKLLHGEAVAIGMICESFISMKLRLLSDNEFKSITGFILGYFELPQLPEADFHQLLELMKQDKKNDGEKIVFTLLNEIGNFSINQSVKEDIITDSLRFYNYQLNEHSHGKSSH